MSKPSDLLQGTLDVLILKILALEPQHAWAIGQRLTQVSRDVLQVSDGSLYPALHKLEQEGWVTAEWKLSENNRRAKYYRLTAAGRRHLDREAANWDRLAAAISLVMVSRLSPDRQEELLHFLLAVADCRTDLAADLALRMVATRDRRFMAQSFSLRYPLVDGSGNFGSLDGDSAAAMRYTECRLARISDELLTEIDQATVPFRPNYDGTKTEPVVLPSRIPNLLINGATGIAVGMVRRQPTFSLVVILTLALAIGANTVIFSFANILMLKPLPLKDSDTLAWIFGVDPHRGGNRSPLSIPEFLDYHAALTSFESLAATSRSSVTMTGRGDARRLTASRVTANLIDVWGLRMAHRGRLNVMAHVLCKPYGQILAEFKDPLSSRSFREDMSASRFSRSPAFSVDAAAPRPFRRVRVLAHRQRRRPISPASGPGPTR